MINIKLYVDLSAAKKDFFYCIQIKPLLPYRQFLTVISGKMIFC